MLGDALVRWSARLFVACYLVRIGIDASGRRDEPSQRVARWFWTIGCGLLLIHTALAFHFVHEYSLASAYLHVLQRTRETTGFETGVGLYVNFAFILLWLSDTALWWRSLAWSRRRVPYWCVQAIFAFLLLQATAVFGPPFWIPVSASVGLALITLRIYGHWTTIRASDSPL